MKTYKILKKQLLKDRAIKKAYDELGPEFELIQDIIERRLKRGITQAKLAQKLGTKQSAISRLEGGAYNPSIAFLCKVAKALDAELSIR